MPTGENLYPLYLRRWLCSGGGQYFVHYRDNERRVDVVARSS